MTPTTAASGTARAETEEPTVLLPKGDCPGGDIEHAALKAGILTDPEDGGPCVWIDLGDTGMSSSYMRDADRVRKFASDLRIFATEVDTIAAELDELQP
ncbi:hypothetical protein ACGF0D_37775 [Kitasatospora sp. NPDC048298]|uniref:hypothetical protein n=1 Tax=Kitasatospora sp. NPDC048298 TaxID=3364049 RepID=UPI00371937BD